MTDQHAMIPPLDLVEQWFNDSPLDRGLTLATRAAQWGADQELEACCEWLHWQNLATHSELIPSLRAALAQPEPVAPTDEEIMELMPETMRDEFSYAAKVCSDAMGGRVKPGIFRVALNTAALEYARAVLAHWGTPANNTGGTH